VELGITNNKEVKLDYTKPFAKNAKLEIGYQLRGFNKATDYTNEVYNYDIDSWSEIDSLFNSMNLDRNVHAAYTTYSNKFKELEFMIGLRGEYTDRVIKQNITGEKYVVNRFDYFPSVHISHPISKIFQTQASYSRRINQPRDYFLDPYTFYIDKYTIRKGNPSLNPEFSDSYELNIQAKFEIPAEQGPTCEQLKAIPSAQYAPPDARDKFLKCFPERK